MPAGGVAAQDSPFDPTYGPAITVNGQRSMVTYNNESGAFSRKKWKTCRIVSPDVARVGS